MIFEKSFINAQVFDVLEFNQKNVSFNVAGRDFNALSFRLNSNAVITAREKSHNMRGGDICLATYGLSYTRVAESDHLIAIHFNSPDITEEEFSSFSSRSPETLEKLFIEILRVQNEKLPDYKYRRAAIFNEILAECYLQNCTENRKSGKISASVEYIKRNFTDPEITVSSAAEKSFMSEVYFRRLFKAEHGISPREYIIQLRIKNAIRLMETGCYTLGEIALLSGWNDYRYFTTEFKRKMGVRPTEYMKNRNPY